MKKFMRKVLALTLVTSMFILTGCSKDSSDNTTTGSGGGGSSTTTSSKTKIRFSTWDSADNLDSQQALVDRFNNSQDEIEVVLEAYGSEYDTKLNASMGAKDAPDVMYMWNYPNYHQQLLPLNDLLSSEGDDYEDNFYEALLEYNALNGDVYGIPVGFTTHALYYNKDLFDQAGVDYPTDDWTWDDLQDTAKTITSNIDGVKGFSYQMKPDPFDFEMYLWSNGTSYMDESGTLDGYLNSPKAIETVEMFQNMAKDGYAVATEKTGKDEFTSQQVAMFIYGAWSIGSFDEAGLNYSISTIPSFERQDSVSIVSTSGVSISSTSQNPEAAWEFVKYWTGEELNIERLDYELSPLKSVVESQKVMDNEKYEPFYTMLDRSSGQVPSSFITDKWSRLSSDLSLAFERVYNPSALQNTSDVLNETVEDFK